jgi:multicomponent K+:H+ antiporter subunit A
MPWTATLGIIAAASMAGVPLLNGFLSKEMFFAEAIDHPAFEGAARYVLPTFAVAAGTLSVAYSARFVHDVFFNGEPVDLPRTPHEPPRWMRLPVEVLVAVCLVVGLMPEVSVGRPILGAAAAAVLGAPPPAYELAVWHGFNLPLAMSALALVSGLLYYRHRRYLFALHERCLPRLSSPVAFERVYRGAARAATGIVTALDGESLQRYLALLVGSALVLGIGAWLGSPAGGWRVPEDGTPADVLALAGLAMLVLGSVGTALRHRERLTAIVFLSVVGLIVSLAFVRFSAPDLALTQLSVEVVSVVLLLLSLRFLPAQAPEERGRGRQARDVGLALAGGAGAALLTYAMLTMPLETISGFYVRNAVPGGGGTNVVNVILVDFRGFDTLGEITVLALAALGVQAVLAGLRLPPHAASAGSEADRHPVMLAMLMQPLLPLALAVSIYILLRGHNLPGGGFIAGLVTAVAFMLQYVARGAGFAEARLRPDYLRLLAAGLVLAAGTGMASWALGHPFLASTFGHLHLPVLGELEIASAMVFDAGVYLVVVGSVLLALSEFGALSRRELAAVCSRDGGA